MSGSSKFNKVWKVKGEWEPKGDTSPALLKPSAWFSEGTLGDLRPCNSVVECDTCNIEAIGSNPFGGLTNIKICLILLWCEGSRWESNLPFCGYGVVVTQEFSKLLSSVQIRVSACPINLRASK